MLVRDSLQARLEHAARGDREAVRPDLPGRLKLERMNVRNGLLKRLASSRAFSLGNRSGVLKAAQNRSGRAFRLDVGQRVVVKALVSRHLGKGADRASALTRHLVYLGRSGAGAEGVRPQFFDREKDGCDPRAVTADWTQDRHHFRVIVSPEHGDRLALNAYTREVMARVAADLGEPMLAWIATCHYDTDQPHAHVLIRGRRADGRDLVIPRDYIGYGLRARAQEVAQERLGDLSRVDAERRIWRETQADRFTSFDRRLLAAADSRRRVDDRAGASDAWAALTRGRLRHLEALGLAVHEPGRYRLDDALEEKLRGLQTRRDVLRTLNQRRLDTGRETRLLGRTPLRGMVVHAGSHDELGAAPFVVVRDTAGTEYYARMRPGSNRLQEGKAVTLGLDGHGFARVLQGRSSTLAR